jgi:hypothetical protein
MPMYDQITISDLQANTDDQSKAKRIPPQAEKVLENIMQFKSLVYTSMSSIFLPTAERQMALQYGNR